MSSSSSPATAAPSFLRGLFHGDITEALLFPYPATLDARRPDEAATVHRLIAALNEMVASGLIDPRQMDEDEAIGEPVITAFAGAGLLALTIPTEYGGLGLSASAYARVFGAVASVDASLGVLIGGTDFKSLQVVLKSTTKDGVETVTAAIKYGAFINSMVEFAIVVLCAFIVVKLMNKVIALRMSDMRAAMEGIQSAADLKKATAKFDDIKRIID